MPLPKRLARLRLLELEDRALPAPLLRVHDASGRLLTVDVPTGDVQLIGSMGTVMYDIAFDGSGKLFGVDGGSTLYTIDVNTAATTEIGDLGAAVNSLVFSHGGELFAAGSGLYRVDTGSGAATNIGDLGSFNSAGDLAFDGDGNLFLSTTSNDLVSWG